MSWISKLFNINKPKTRKHLSDADKLGVIESYESGISRKDIANKYGVSYSTVAKLIRRNK